MFLLEQFKLIYVVYFRLCYCSSTHIYSGYVVAMVLLLGTNFEASLMVDAIYAQAQGYDLPVIMTWKHHGKYAPLTAKLICHLIKIFYIDFSAIMTWKWAKLIDFSLAILPQLCRQVS